MSKNVYSSGLRNVGSYQVSGEPFVTGSTISDGAEQQIEFPQVTNNITVKYNATRTAVSWTGRTANDGGGFFVSNLDSSPDEMNDGDPYTIVAWMKVTHVPADTNKDYLFYTTGGAGTRSIYLRYIDSSDRLSVHMFFHDGATEVIEELAVVGCGLADGRYHHLAIAQNGSGEVSVYLDGQEIGTATYSIGSHESQEIESLYIGHGSAAQKAFWSELAIFKHFLDDTEIEEAYNSGSHFDLRSHSQNTDLVHYWVFGDNPNDVLSPKASIEFEDLTSENRLLPVSIVNGEGELLVEKIALGGEARIHFRSSGSLPNVETNRHYWSLKSHETSEERTFTMNVKTKEIYISANGGDVDYSLHADLTNIPSSRMYQHTGSGVDE